MSTSFEAFAQHLCMYLNILYQLIDLAQRLSTTLLKANTIAYPCKKWQIHYCFPKKMRAVECLGRQHYSFPLFHWTRITFTLCYSKIPQRRMSRIFILGQMISFVLTWNRLETVSLKSVVIPNVSFNSAFLGRSLYFNMPQYLNACLNPVLMFCTNLVSGRCTHQL